MTHADWEGVCDGMKMASGLFWPIPVTLSTDQATADTIYGGLKDEDKVRDKDVWSFDQVKALETVTGEPVTDELSLK